MQKGNTEVDVQALRELEKNYRRYIQSVSGHVKRGIQEGKNEKSRVPSKYKKYSYVQNSVSQVEKVLEELQKLLREFELDGNEISRGLANAVRLYQEEERQSERLVGKTGVKLKALSMQGELKEAHTSLKKDKLEETAHYYLHDVKSVFREKLRLIEGHPYSLTDEEAVNLGLKQDRSKWTQEELEIAMNVFYGKMDGKGTSIKPEGTYEQPFSYTSPYRGAERHPLIFDNPAIGQIPGYAAASGLKQPEKVGLSKETQKLMENHPELYDWIQEGLKTGGVTFGGIKYNIEDANVHTIEKMIAFKYLDQVKRQFTPTGTNWQVIGPDGKPLEYDAPRAAEDATSIAYKRHKELLKMIEGVDLDAIEREQELFNRRRA